jgi:hypothetical protein
MRPDRPEPAACNVTGMAEIQTRTLAVPGADLVLGQQATVFPSHHGGFLGGQHPADVRLGDGREPRLGRCLTRRSSSAVPLVRRR